MICGEEACEMPLQHAERDGEGREHAVAQRLHRLDTGEDGLAEARRPGGHWLRPRKGVGDHVGMARSWLTKKLSFPVGPRRLVNGGSALHGGIDWKMDVVLVEPQRELLLERRRVKAPGRSTSASGTP